nr:MAG TPA: hypothetical protein [Caudoviricetes sp.]
MLLQISINLKTPAKSSGGLMLYRKTEVGICPA